MVKKKKPQTRATAHAVSQAAYRAPMIPVVFGCFAIVALAAVLFQFSSISPLSHQRPTSLGVTHSPQEPAYVLSTDELFTYVDPMVIQPESGTVSMLATGDVLLARSVNAKMRRFNDFNWPFAKTSEFLQRPEIALINLETPLVGDCPTKEDGMIFCGDLKGAAAIKDAGIDVVNIANNHTENYGQKGVEQTVQALQGQGLAYTGLSQPVIKTVGRQRFGFLGFTDVGRTDKIIDVSEDEEVIKQVQALRPQVDVLIVSYHWGEEYRTTPTARQKALAHLTIDAGADVIIGNHPHWVQSVEQYNGKWISYSHGNFIFDQMWSRETREGVVGWYVFNQNGLIDVKFLPVIIEDYGQPRFATEKEALPILNRMKEASE